MAVAEQIKSLILLGGFFSINKILAVKKLKSLEK